MNATTAAMSGRFFVGTCGYSYPGDPPHRLERRVLPEARKKSADNLAHYAAFFNVVEINSVFYRPGERGLGAQLAAKRTGADFVFAV